MHAAAGAAKSLFLRWPLTPQAGPRPMVPHPCPSFELIFTLQVLSAPVIEQNYALGANHFGYADAIEDAETEGRRRNDRSVPGNDLPLREPQRVPCATTNGPWKRPLGRGRSS
jgi:hypothetical protein